MAKNSAVNLDITNNADGFDISGGTTKRKVTVTGADLTFTGSGANQYIFPSASDTLVGLVATQTLTNKTLDAVIMTSNPFVNEFSTGTTGAILSLRKARGTGTTTVANGDTIGDLKYQAYGTSFGTRASIQAVVNGTVTSNNVPADLVFYTTATTEASLTERMRISSAGIVTIASNLRVDTNLIYTDATNNNLGINTSTPLADLHVNTSSTGSSPRGILVTQFSSDANGGLISIRKARGTGATIVANGDTLGNLRFEAHGTTSETRADIRAIVNGTVTSNTVPTDLAFRTTATDLASIVEWFRLSNTGVHTFTNSTSQTTLQIDARSAGRCVGINTTSPFADLSILCAYPALEPRGIDVRQYYTGTEGSQVNLSKARGTGTTIVANLDTVGQLRYRAYGTTMASRAEINAIVNGTITSDNVPTDLIFRTTATTEANLATRMIISSGGSVTFGSSSGTGSGIVHLGTLRRTNATQSASSWSNEIDFSNMYLSSTGGFNFYMDIDNNTTSDAFQIIAGNGSYQSGTVLFSVNEAGAVALTTVSATTALNITHNVAGGEVINLATSVSSASNIIGLKFNLANSGAGQEYAMRFDGSEIDNTAVGGTQDKKIKVSVAGTDYFIPLHTA
jgi:hypothetical protein